MLAVIKILVSGLTFFWFMEKNTPNGLLGKMSDKRIIYLLKEVINE